MITIDVKALGLMDQFADEVVHNYSTAAKSVELIIDDWLALQINTSPITKGTIDYSDELAVDIECEIMLDALLSLRKMYGGFMYVDTAKALHWTTTLGSNTGQQVRYNKNLSSVRREIDYTYLINRLYAYGAGGLSLSSMNNRESLYSGSEEYYLHDAAMPIGGSLVRVRCAIYDLMYQRVTSPDEDSDYGTWTDWAVDAYDVAICELGTDMLIFYVSKDDGHLYRKESANSGGAWGAWQDMGDITGTVDFRVAACYKSAAEAIVIYSDGTDIYRNRWDSVGGWEGFNVWTLAAWDTIKDIAVCYYEDWDIALGGWETATENVLSTVIFGDGGNQGAATWSALFRVLGPQTEEYGYTFLTLARPDVFRLIFAWSNAEVSPTLTGTFEIHAPDSGDNFHEVEWTESEEMIGDVAAFSLCVIYPPLGPYLWITRARNVYRKEVPIVDYVENVASQAAHGKIARPKTNRDITDGWALRQWAVLTLADVDSPRYSYDGDVIDLWGLGAINFEKLELGNTILLLDEELGIDVAVQIVRIRYPDVNQLGNIQIELSNRVEDITDRIAELQKLNT